MERPQHGPTLLQLVGEISAIDRLEPLDAYPGQVMELVRAQLADGVDALAVSLAVAEANDALTRRLLALGESHLGPPPCRYAWLALGSHGRREQVLSSDQDSALAYETALPGEEPAAREYFSTLAELVVAALDRAGLPLCDGGYMATNWCLPFDEFGRLFRGWIEQPQPQALLQAEVFLDVRACHGDLPTDALDRILVRGGHRGPFRAQMARAAVTFRPPLDWFGRLRTHDSTLDLKRGGTAAIVLLARLYALTAGSTEHSTVQRLRAASAGGTLNLSSAGDLIDAYRFLTDLRLRHQVDQASQGLATDNRIFPDQLTLEQRSTLRATLRVVKVVQEFTALRFATHTVS